MEGDFPRPPVARRFPTSSSGDSFDGGRFPMFSSGDSLDGGRFPGDLGDGGRSREISHVLQWPEDFPRPPVATAAMEGDFSGTLAMEGDFPGTSAMEGDFAMTAAMEGDSAMIEAMEGDFTATEEGDFTTTFAMIESMEGDFTTTMAMEGDFAATAAMEGDFAATAAMEGGFATTAAMEGDFAATEGNFPPGYRFVPTDEELILKYLKPKIKNEPIPIRKIREVNLSDYNPQVLLGIYPPIGEKDWYFFTPRDRKYPKGNRPNRAAGDGYWKSTGADKMVIDAENNRVGFRKALVFYRGKPPNGEKTRWIMHEYRMDQPPRVNTNPGDMRLDDWVLCRICPKPIRQNQNQDANAVAGDGHIPHVAEEQPDKHSVAPVLGNVPENVANQGPVLIGMPENVKFLSSCDVSDYGFSMSPLIDNPLGLRNWPFPQDYSANWGIQNSYGPSASTSAESFLPGPSTSAFQDSVIKSKDCSPDDVQAGKKRRF